MRRRIKARSTNQGKNKRTTRWRDHANAVVATIGNDDVARRIQTDAIRLFELNLQWIGAVDVPRITRAAGHRRHH